VRDSRGDFVPGWKGGCLIRWFIGLTAVNVVCAIVLALTVLSPGALAYVLWPRASEEVKLVPLEGAPERGSNLGATPLLVQDAPSLDAYRSPDLTARPWEVLPGGAVRIRE